MSILLVIEGESEVRLHLQHALETEGYCVLLATNGQEGLRLLRDQTVDLVLVDIFVPGIDGLDLIKQMRDIRPSSKIVAMSGGIGQWNYLTVAMHVGAHMTLQKPFRRQELLDVVRSQLRP